MLILLFHFRYLSKDEKNKVDSSGCCPAVSNKNVVIILTTIITCKTLIMAHFFSRYNKEWTREKQTDKIYQLWGGRELSAEVQKAPPCLCHRCLVVAHGRRHFTVVYLHSSLFIQASKRTLGITFLTWSPQNMAVFPSTSATSERSLGQAWFFFLFVLKTHLFCLRTATFQFKAPTPNYRDNCRNARCILHHHHRMPPNAPSINSDELKKKKVTHEASTCT